MAKEIVNYVIQYRKIREYLKEEGYTSAELSSVMSSLRRMDAETLHAFLHWFSTGEYPKKPLHGVNIAALVEFRSMKPAAAFLAADWMGRAPANAYAVLSVGVKDHGSMSFADEIPDDLTSLLEEMERNHTNAQANEDTSDFKSSKPEETK